MQIMFLLSELPEELPESGGLIDMQFLVSPPGATAVQCNDHAHIITASEQQPGIQCAVQVLLRSLSLAKHSCLVIYSSIPSTALDRIFGQAAL
jgi:hypothetical protein